MKISQFSTEQIITILDQAEREEQSIRIYALLRRSQRVNRKRIHRLWKQTRLQMHKRRRKRRQQPAGHLPVKATYPG